MSDQLDLIVNTVGLVLFLGALAGTFAEKNKIPKMLPLILIGIILNFIAPSFIIDFSNEQIKSIALIFAELGLFLVLYQEGMHLHIRHLMINIVPIVILAVAGTILTTILVGLALTGFILTTTGSISVALGIFLIAGIVVPTDPAATFSILKSPTRKIKNHLKTILGGESAFNDVIAILIVIILLLPQIEEGHSFININIIVILLVIWQLVGGILLGIATTMTALFFIGKVKNQNEIASITLTSVLAIFSLSIQLNVSGAIAALTAGILLTNPHYIRMKRRYKEAYMTPFWDKIVFLVEIFSFTAIGSLLQISKIIEYIGPAIILAIIVFIVLLIAVFITTYPMNYVSSTSLMLTNKDRIFIAVAGFKGLTTAVLALLSYLSLLNSNIPNIEPFADAMLYTSLILILVSGFAQALALPYVSKMVDAYEE